MKVRIGNIYWLKLEDKITHPHVVTKLINDNKVLVTKITTNQKKAHLPGNIILNENEGNLEKPSIIDVADTFEIKINQLGDYIGELNQERVEQVLNGIGFLDRAYFKN